MTRRPARATRPGDHVTVIRRSRKRRTCEDCHGPIFIGEEYARLSLPPSADYSPGRWWSMAVHASWPCPERLA